MGEKQITERLRTCCSYCGSPNIRKVKSLRIYRCNACNQSFVTPSLKLVESYKLFPKYLIITQEKKE
jgi:ribosomal protein L37AE/L43A